MLLSRTIAPRRQHDHNIHWRLPHSCLFGMPSWPQDRRQIAGHSRLHLVNHLADKRVRSKARQTNCGIVFLSADPPMVEAYLLSTFMASDKLERQQARKLGHTRPIVGAAAKKGGPSCLKGVSTACVKRRYAPHRRLGGKADPRHSPACRQGSLASRNCVQHTAGQAARMPRVQQDVALLPLKRLSCKTTPVEGGLFKRHRGTDYSD